MPQSLKHNSFPVGIFILIKQFIAVSSKTCKWRGLQNAAFILIIFIRFLTCELNVEILASAKFTKANDERPRPPKRRSRSESHRAAASRRCVADMSERNRVC